MESASPDMISAADGPNKKTRLLEDLQLPESLYDPVSHLNGISQHAVPADEARRQLGTLQLDSGPASPKVAAGDAAGAQNGEATGTAPPAVAADAVTCAAGAQGAAHAANAEQAADGGAPGADTTAVTPATVELADEAGGAIPHREASLEPAPSDQGAGVSADYPASSAALDAGDDLDGEGEVLSGGAGGDGAAGADGRSVGYEVFIGGLAADCRDDEVREALSTAGKVLAVRLQRMRGTLMCKGYGFATFADAHAAERAVAEIKEVGGRRVGLHPSRRPFRAVLAAAQQQQGPGPVLQADPDLDASINALLTAIRSHPDRAAAVAAALQVVQRGPKRAFSALQGDTSVGNGATAAAPGAHSKRPATAAAAAAAAVPGVKIEPEAESHQLGPAAAEEGAADEGAAGELQVAEDQVPQPGEAEKAADGERVAEASPAPTGDAAQPAAAACAEATGSGAAAVAGGKAGSGAAVAATSTGAGTPPPAPQELAVALAACPKTALLLEMFKGANKMPKTPLMVLHEYATKMTYKVEYNETSDGPAGPYNVEARLVSGGSNGTTVVASSGKARTKKDAKQVAAATALEKLLERRSAADFLPAGEDKKGVRGARTQAGDRHGLGYGYRKGTPGGDREHDRGERDRGGRDRDRDYRGPPPRDPYYYAPPPPPPMRGGPPFGPYGSGPHGPMDRGGPFGRPFNSGASNFVQPGLPPAAGHGYSPAGGRPGDAAPGPFSGRGGHNSHGGGFGGGGGPSGYASMTSPQQGGGGGGSMVQTGLGGSGQGGPTPAMPQGRMYGSLYGGDAGQGAGGGNLDSYGGANSYDMASGQKRNYSTAMQAGFGQSQSTAPTYGTPASSQGISLQPMSGAPGSVGSGGPGAPGQPPLFSQMQAFGQSGPGIGIGQQVLFQQALGQQQQQQMFQAVAGQQQQYQQQPQAQQGLFAGTQQVRLEPAQPATLLAVQPAQQQPQQGLYGGAQAQQPQQPSLFMPGQQQQQQGAAMYGMPGQAQLGLTFAQVGSGPGPQGAPAGGLGSGPGLQALGYGTPARPGAPGGSIWG